MTAKIAASTEIAYTAQENEHARLSKLYNLYFEYSFLKIVPQNLQDVVPTALSVNVSVPFPHTEYCSSQAETLHSFFPEGWQQPGTFTSQDRPCMKTGRSGTELFFTFCHSLSSLCPFFTSTKYYLCPKLAHDGKLHLSKSTSWSLLPSQPLPRRSISVSQATLLSCELAFPGMHTKIVAFRHSWPSLSLVWSGEKHPLPHGAGK